MTKTLSALLIQARHPGDPILEHELQCFIAQSTLPAGAFSSINLTEEAWSPELLDAHDVLFVGGSGDFSVVSGQFPWHQSLLELMRTIAQRRQPMFASCFGFQALAQALGGTLAKDPERAELGTFPMTLTPQGSLDPLFAPLAPGFDAQLGHNDSVITLPPSLLPMAQSTRCPIQAIRLEGAPIWATQFHPELTDLDNITRYLRYIEAYKRPEDSMDEARQKARQMHWPSPQANQLIADFISLVQKEL